jgi:biotin carboxylase
MTAGKSLLIVSAGEAAASAAKRAKEMGLTVVMSDADPASPAFAFADSVLIADAREPTETSAAAERFNRKIRKLDGVIGAGHASPVTVATVAQRLRLPGIPVHVAELIQDRLSLKKSFVSAGIASPWHAEVRTLQELQRAVIAQGGDLTIAPPDGAGDAGVLRLSSVEDLAGAFTEARAHSPTERVMVEKNLDGPELWLQGVIQEWRCVSASILERDGGVPAEEMHAPLGEFLARAAGAAGITDGAVTAAIVMHQGQPHLLSLKVSLSDLASQAPRTGLDFIGAAIRLALGEKWNEG